MIGKISWKFDEDHTWCSCWPAFGTCRTLKVPDWWLEEGVIFDIMDHVSRWLGRYPESLVNIKHGLAVWPIFWTTLTFSQWSHMYEIINKLSSAKYQLENSFNYKGAWEIWIVPDWNWGLGRCWWFLTGDIRSCWEYIWPTFGTWRTWRVPDWRLEGSSLTS